MPGTYEFGIVPISTLQGNRPDYNQFLCVTILTNPLVIASQMIVSIVSKPPVMSTNNSTSISSPHIHAVTVDKANAIASLITKARRYREGGVPLTQDEQERLDNWLAESDNNITLYSHLTDPEYLNMLRSIDLKVEKKEVRKIHRSNNPTWLVRMWRLLKARATKLISHVSKGN